MIVRENINFERGINPKTSMGIGKAWNVKDIIEIYKQLLDIFNYSKGGLLPREQKYKTDFGWEIVSAIPSRLKKEVGWENLDKIMYDLDNEEFEKIKKIILKYYNKFKK